ncbi:hypothetical protein [Trichococcus collinsii]|uniref:hypothetical protein n=1 Tax=Trichococcus collinsii TaxID=157076 RepID=UPI001C40A2AA|nr:hypothetical protein [Trichococcus collinsii]
MFAPTHQATENAILKTGIPYSFLRNNWYLENDVSSIQGVPDFVIPILLAIQKSIREGSLDVESDDFEKLLGSAAEC